VRETVVRLEASSLMVGTRWSRQGLKAEHEWRAVRRVFIRQLSSLRYSSVGWYNFQRCQVAMRAPGEARRYVLGAKCSGLTLCTT